MPHKVMNTIMDDRYYMLKALALAKKAYAREKYPLGQLWLRQKERL